MEGNEYMLERKADDGDKIARQTEKDTARNRQAEYMTENAHTAAINLLSFFQRYCDSPFFWRPKVSGKPF